jgi:hypothetical protein
MVGFVNEIDNQVTTCIGLPKSRIHVLPGAIPKFDEAEPRPIEKDLFNLILQYPMLNRKLLNNIWQLNEVIYIPEFRRLLYTRISGFCDLRLSGYPLASWSR